MLSSWPLWNGQENPPGNVKWSLSFDLISKKETLFREYHAAQLKKKKDFLLELNVFKIDMVNSVNLI